MSKWNKVTDKMPPKTDKCYLVFCDGDRCQYTAHINDCSGKWESWNLEGISKEVKDQSIITHWREMPKNP